MNKFTKSLVALSLAAAGSAFAGPLPTLNVTVNGGLSDWGITLANNNGSNILPQGVAPGTGSFQCTINAAWACEDSNDNAATFNQTGSFVGPEYGGQDYDVEFLGIARGTGLNANRLYIGIASGLRPDNGFYAAGKGLYAPGDLFFTINGIQYVMEMGGGAPGASGTNPELQGAAGSLYTLDAQGFTTGTTSLANQVVGSIWKVTDGTLFYGPGNAGPTQWQRSAGAVSLGTADVYSTRNSLTGNQNQHSVWEIGMDIALFPANGNPVTSINNVYWDPACYNDVLSVTGFTMATVPAPSSLLLCALGLLGFAGRRRRAAVAK